MNTTKKQTTTPKAKTPEPKPKSKTSVTSTPIRPSSAASKTSSTTTKAAATATKASSATTKAASSSATKAPLSSSTTQKITANDIWLAKGPPPDKTLIVLPDSSKWEAYSGKFYKVPELGYIGDIRVDDSLLIIDPINIIPGEKCTCGRPKTELEKTGIYTYGDYLKKCTIKGSLSNPYGKSLKYADSKPGLAAIIRSYEKPADFMIPVLFKKRSNQRVGDVIIRF
jgi:hypothetical protein